MAWSCGNMWKSSIKQAQHLISSHIGDDEVVGSSLVQMQSGREEFVPRLADSRRGEVQKQPINPVKVRVHLQPQEPQFKSNRPAAALLRFVKSDLDF
eukprot:4791287-Amphidinium_carterae.1